jgi:transcriptional regulator with XRE-family HTH domain
MKAARAPQVKSPGPVTLKAVAEYVGLTPGTVSAVLNNSAAARSIPEHTRKRILEAARVLNYRPNFLARSLRVQRTYTVGVIAEEIGDAYGGLVVSGIEAYLRENEFFFLTVAHRHDPKLLRTYSSMLMARGVEGLITIDTSIDAKPELPMVAVAGHQTVENVTNIVIDHHRAAELALAHLKELGHERILQIVFRPRITTVNGDPGSSRKVSGRPASAFDGAGNHSGDEPAELAHLHDHKQRASLVKDSDRAAEVIDFGHGCGSLYEYVWVMSRGGAADPGSHPGRVAAHSSHMSRWISTAL